MTAAPSWFVGQPARALEAACAGTAGGCCALSSSTLTYSMVDNLSLPAVHCSGVHAAGYQHCVCLRSSSLGKHCTDWRGCALSSLTLTWGSYSVWTSIYFYMTLDHKQRLNLKGETKKDNALLYWWLIEIRWRKVMLHAASKQQDADAAVGDCLLFIEWDLSSVCLLYLLFFNRFYLVLGMMCLLTAIYLVFAVWTEFIYLVFAVYWKGFLYLVFAPCAFPQRACVRASLDTSTNNWRKRHCIKASIYLACRKYFGDTWRSNKKTLVHG